MRARSVIHSNESLNKLLESGTLWHGEKTTRLKVTGESELTLEAAPFLIEEIDLILNGGLSFGQVHEWRTLFFGNDGNKKTLIPPHLILCSILRNTLKQPDPVYNNRVIVWIGRECWPSTHLLNLLSKNLNWNWQKQVLLIDSQTKQERLAAFRTCLRSKGVLAAIGDASGFNLVSTRQLQFAARLGESIGILLRREETSALPAFTKWLVKPSQTTQPFSPLKGIRSLDNIISWELSLLKSPGLAAEKTWKVQIEKSELLLSQHRQQEEALISQEEARYVS